MNKLAYIIISLIVLGGGAVAYFVFGRQSNSPSDDYFLSTQGQSNERIQNLDLDKASEDASYILDTAKLSFPDYKTQTENIDYQADPEREWIIDLIQVNGENFNKSDFTKMFDYEWRNNYASTLYGLSAEDNHWTYADGGGTPDIYSKLQVAIELQGVYNEENPNYDRQKLERYIVELEKRIKKYPTKLRLEPKESIDNAIAKAKNLVELYNAFNADVVIVLQSTSEYKGMEMWDALQSIGLTWGDGDLFHWDNTEGYGSDQHFSVWTSTEPGYFMPEEIRAGAMNPQNLIFGFSLPRSVDPKNIYDIMLNSAKYCQKRLGGQLLDEDGQPLNEEQEKQRLVELLNKMESKGIKAGSDKALRMF